MKTSTAEFIKEARKRMGVTQEKFAEMIEKSRCDIANYETGRAIPPGDVILRIQEKLKNRQSNRLA